MEKKNKLKLIVWGTIAIIVGLVFSFYHLVIPKLWGVKPYSPLSLNQLSPSVAVDEAIFYASKAREIIDGNFWLSDLMVAEYKQSSPIFMGEMIPSSLIALLSIFGGGIDNGFIIADFLFPALGFLIIGWFLYLLTNSHKWSMIGALLTMFFYHYLSSIPYFPSIIKLIIISVNLGNYSMMIRSFHPQISLLIFILFLGSLFKRKVKTTGVLLGMLSYSHFFYFSFGVALLGLRLKKNIKILLIGVLVSLPYLINLLVFQQSSLSKEFLEKIYFSPRLNVNQLISLCLGIILSWLIINKKKKQFFSDIFITGLFLALGANLVKFGLDDPVGHWMLRVINPSLVMLGVLVLAERVKVVNGLIATLIIALLVGYQGRVHWQYFKHQAQAYQIESEKVELFNWLNQNTAKNSVVISANLKDNLYLSIFTHNNSFIPRAQISLAPTKEAEERFLISQKLISKTESEIISMFENNNNLKQKKRFDFDNCAGVYLYFRQFVNNDYYNCSVSKTKLESLLKKYQDLEIDLNKYQADYYLNIDPFDQGKLVWQNNQYQVYQH